jgi:hypothetical protein
MRFVLNALLQSWAAYTLPVYGDKLLIGSLALTNVAEMTVVVEKVLSMRKMHEQE